MTLAQLPRNCHALECLCATLHVGNHLREALDRIAPNAIKGARAHVQLLRGEFVLDLFYVFLLEHMMVARFGGMMSAVERLRLPHGIVEQLLQRAPACKRGRLCFALGKKLYETGEIGQGMLAQLVNFPIMFQRIRDLRDEIGRVDLNVAHPVSPSVRGVSMYALRPFAKAIDNLVKIIYLVVTV